MPCPAFMLKPQSVCPSLSLSGHTSRHAHASQACEHVIGALACTKEGQHRNRPQVNVAMKAGHRHGAGTGQEQSCLPQMAMPGMATTVTQHGHTKKPASCHAWQQ